MSMFNDGIFREDDLVGYTQPSYDRERQIYYRLIGYYQTLPEAVNVNSLVSNSPLWEQFNKTVDEIVSLGHADFEKHKITEEKIGQFNSRPAVNIHLLKTNINSMLWEMSAKFFFQNPKELIGISGSSPVVQQVNSQHQTQQQKQEQEMELTIEQKMQALNKVINDNMSPEQIAAITLHLEKFQKEPHIWKNAQSLIQGVLGFGKDIASQTIASILAFYINGGR